ncbi:hypothetical protein [Flavobacterium muglaense]|uniref:Uncharacterized protein n=1 Tax=Flavobacterium muglaense TaxID=2764716 RepID=A0A923N1N2_9FLAO|nr:hypothetical protein [Flavobacterium muglaense]MBC5839204.1 hypothetical protein [Flavobacterium muglaense]MBC5845679.1 hypothetical protein [Flavobacterium muglaense]
MNKKIKITVKHYINDKLKANGFSERKKYPIYVRVSFLRKNFRFRSTFLKWYYTESDFEITENKKVMDYETEIINFIVEKDNSIDDLSQYLYLMKYDIINVVKQDLLSKRLFEGLNFYEKIGVEINNLIHIKTNINSVALWHVLKIDREVNNDFFALIDENLIDNEKVRRYLLFIKMILKFEKDNYNDVYFNCYEWKYKKGKLKFIEYFENNNLDFFDVIYLIDSYIDVCELDHNN